MNRLKCPNPDEFKSLENYGAVSWASHERPFETARKDGNEGIPILASELVWDDTSQPQSGEVAAVSDGEANIELESFSIENCGEKKETSSQKT